MLSDEEPAAETHRLDAHRDAAVVRSLAAEVVANHGGDIGRMRRALGFSNATWIGDGLAVRIANAPDVGAMSAEAALVRALPPEVGHPRLIAAGTIEGHDWIVTEEVPGENLQEAWPTLTAEQQRQAIRELWARVRVVHEASAVLRRFVGSHAGFIPAAADDAMAAAARVGAPIGLTDRQRFRLQEVIDGYFRAAPLVEQVVNHGDLAFMNALWNGRVVALLDFEFALLGPVEIDLCRLLFESLVSKDGQPTHLDVGAAAVALATRDTDPVHGRTLLHGAAVLDQLRDVEIWLARRTEEWRPDRLLVGLLDEDAGYLEAVLA